MRKFKWEFCYAPFYIYDGGEEGLAHERKKEQERIKRRERRNEDVVKVIEFIFNNPSVNEINELINDPSVPKRCKGQLYMLTKHFNQSLKNVKHINKEWNYVLKMNPSLFEKIASILKNERNRGTVNIKDGKILYFNRCKIFQNMKSVDWGNNEEWLPK